MSLLVKMGQAKVAGGGIIKRIQGCDREVEGHTSPGEGRRADGKVGGRRRTGPGHCCRCP